MNSSLLRHCALLAIALVLTACGNEHKEDTSAISFKELSSSTSIDVAAVKVMQYATTAVTSDESIDSCTSIEKLNIGSQDLVIIDFLNSCETIGATRGKMFIRYTKGDLSNAVIELEDLIVDDMMLRGSLEADLSNTESITTDQDLTIMFSDGLIASRNGNVQLLKTIDAYEIHGAWITQYGNGHQHHTQVDVPLTYALACSNFSSGGLWHSRGDFSIEESVSYPCGDLLD